MAMDLQEEKQHGEEESEISIQANVVFSVDEIVEKYVGGFGRAQLFQVVIIALGWAFDSQNTFLPIFTDAQPSWRCTNSTSLWDTCTEKSSICEMDRREWEWDRGQAVSIISEWDLICTHSYQAAMPQTFFFVGALLGCIILGPLADSSVGRKRMLLVSSLVLSITGFLTALSPNIWFYSLLRALSGFGRAPIGICCLVLSTEIVGRKWRGLTGFLVFFTCTLGFLSLPPIAYFTRLNFSWRSTYIYLSVFPLTYSLFILPFIWESPRWLVVRGKSQEAMQSLKRMTELNGRKLPENLTVDYCNTESQKIESTLSLLLMTKWARRRLGFTMAVGFGIGVVYYGIPLGSGNLDFNLYMGVTFNALSEIPGALISTVLLVKAGRRRTFFMLAVGSGIFCFVCAFLSLNRNSGERNWWEMGTELGAFLSSVMAFNVLLIYCLELFPSSVRNSAMSMLRQAINVGAIVSPVIVEVGHGAPYLSFAIFGITIILSGLFVLGLPETKDRPLYDTMKGQEWQECHCDTSLVAPLLS